MTFEKGFEFFDLAHDIVCADFQFRVLDCNSYLTSELKFDFGGRLRFIEWIEDRYQHRWMQVRSTRFQLHPVLKIWMRHAPYSDIFKSTERRFKVLHKGFYCIGRLNKLTIEPFQINRRPQQIVYNDFAHAYLVQKSWLCDGSAQTQIRPILHKGVVQLLNVSVEQQI